MLRLINGRGINLLSLARNARTSVEMIDRFYAKHLTAEMNVIDLQSHANERLEEITNEVRQRVRENGKSEHDHGDTAP
jgi:ribosomal protein L31E